MYNPQEGVEDTPVIENEEIHHFEEETPNVEKVEESTEIIDIEQGRKGIITHQQQPEVKMEIHASFVEDPLPMSPAEEEEMRASLVKQESETSNRSHQYPRKKSFADPSAFVANRLASLVNFLLFLCFYYQHHM